MKKGIVMQIDDAYLTLLTPDGQFLQARKKNYPYVLGEEIRFTPITERSTKKPRLQRFFSLKPLLISAAVLFLLIGSSYIPVFQSNKAYAYMSIDVNPSIELGINKQMQVVKLTPFNDDGKKILSKLGHWQKKEVSTIAQSILDLMKKEGYLKKNHLVIISTVRMGKPVQKIETQLTKSINAIKADVKEDSLQLTLLTGTETEMEQAHKLGMTTGKYKETKLSPKQDQEKAQESEKVKEPEKTKQTEKAKPAAKAQNPVKTNEPKQHGVRKADAMGNPGATPEGQVKMKKQPSKKIEVRKCTPVKKNANNKQKLQDSHPNTSSNGEKNESKLKGYQKNRPVAAKKNNNKKKNTYYVRSIVLLDVILAKKNNIEKGNAYSWNRGQAKKQWGFDRYKQSMQHKKGWEKHQLQ